MRGGPRPELVHRQAGGPCPAALVLGRANARRHQPERAALVEPVEPVALAGGSCFRTLLRSPCPGRVAGALHDRVLAGLRIEKPEVTQHVPELAAHGLEGADSAALDFRAATQASAA
jgi:hypothetical protein